MTISTKAKIIEEQLKAAFEQNNDERWTFWWNEAVALNTLKEKSRGK